MLHVLKHPRQLTQGDFPVDEVAGADLAAGDGIECLADEARCMVEGGLDGDLRVVQRCGIELYQRAPGAAAEQVDRAAATHHLDGPLPSDRRADRFHHRIGAPAALSELQHPPHGIVELGDIEGGARTQTLGSAHLARALSQRDHGYPAPSRETSELQANSPAAHPHGAIARLETNLVDAALPTRQWLI